MALASDNVVMAVIDPFHLDAFQWESVWQPRAGCGWCKAVWWSYRTAR
jgi:hypothetical protein